jgi:hypothetical protein
MCAALEALGGARARGLSRNPARIAQAARSRQGLYPFCTPPGRGSACVLEAIRGVIGPETPARIGSGATIAGGKRC